MNDILQKQTVLVLNRNWQAINVRTPQDAIAQLAADAATALDITDGYMNPVPWEKWIDLPIREGDEAVHTSTRAIRIPTVIVLCNYAKVPKKRPRLTSRTIWERDQGTCQYTGKKLSRSEANIDHIVPRSKGGGTTWKNCVLADKRVNSVKADQDLKQTGLTLIRTPQEPKELPVTVLIKNNFEIADWNHFLIA